MPKKPNGRKKQPAKIQQLATNVLESYSNPEYCSTSKDKDTHAEGCSIDATLKQVSRAARHIEKPDVKVAQCIGSSQCHKQWVWPRNQSCVLSHAAGCPWVPAELRHEADIKLAAKAHAPGKTTSHQASGSKRKLSEGDSNSLVCNKSGRSDGEKSGKRYLGGRHCGLNELKLSYYLFASS